ncbi:hypothetical protein Desti_4006 [Desulfomonile tiedjei DSM 6799]|uniref:Uncharacterized protein n=1 Tax=Desulfomonile tiedjei (strain ATCC 49306 / DSM 6799 / DCB-1) TaxID=706587 RepID=I4CAQ5_DESTA|nr:hypothetical protein Desti_4006 [Desulfomonile tiedjei DSM 6799]
MKLIVDREVLMINDEYCNKDLTGTGLLINK